MRHRRPITLFATLLCVGGCGPIGGTTRYVTEPTGVASVTVWESPRTGHDAERFAVVRGRPAAEIVECMTWDDPQYAIFRVVVVVGTKATADAGIERIDGTRVRVAFSNNDYFCWDGPQGRLDARFADRYAALPWQPGSPPASTTRPSE